MILKIVTSRVVYDVRVVTWRHQWRHQSTCRRQFAIGSLLDTNP